MKGTHGDRPPVAHAPPVALRVQSRHGRAPMCRSSWHRLHDLWQLSAVPSGVAAADPDGRVAI